MSRGLLVVVEGINGAGKSAIINELLKHYKHTRRSAALYKFPSRSGELGQKINAYLTGKLKITSKYDVLDMFARDREMAKIGIKKDLAEGKIVICDRYFFSAVAYHIPINVSERAKINLYCRVIGHFDKGMPIPDITYLIDGHHLAKRGIVKRELFHYMGAKSQALHSILHWVIDSFTQQYMNIKNKDGHLDDIVRDIINDINLRMC